jgi:hypothetical protein
MTKKTNPSPRDFECPACHALPGTPCRSTRGKSQPTFHTLRLYRASDAWAAAHGSRAGAKASKRS